MSNRIIHTLKQLAYFANREGLSFVVVPDPEEGTKLLIGSKGNRFYPHDFNQDILANPRHRWATVRLARKIEHEVAAQAVPGVVPDRSLGGPGAHPLP